MPQSEYYKMYHLHSMQFCLDTGQSFTCPFVYHLLTIQVKGFGVCGFKCRPGRTISSVFVVFLSPSMQMPGQYLEPGQYHFLACPFQFVIYTQSFPPTHTIQSKISLNKGNKISQSNVDNLKNVRREASRHFRNKKEE